MTARLRCAIYTRKSTEEGLEQQFNSLHAQREACEAYALSQAGEGWVALKTEYDDGGYSGGSMERPGLKALLSDIQRGLIDIVVVYKVDRLTRSLADFAKIVELFDARGVSFVSVTQAFNTTTSMGRLTLNVLLSFAQFEREVTGERIRDKIAASKAKGLRMGGQPPMGYDIVEGRLAPNEKADRVRSIFRQYLELGSLKALAKDGVEARCWTTQAGKQRGGGFMTISALNHLLRNPAYRGTTRHKDKLYENTHPAVIDQDLWDRVQAQLDSANASQHATRLRKAGALLEQKLVDDRGNPMVPVHTPRGPKRYRYYVSRASMTGEGTPGSVHRISAGTIEEFIRDRVAKSLTAAWRPDDEIDVRLFTAVRKVTISSSQIEVRLDPAALRPDTASASFERDDAVVRLAFHMHRRQGAIILSGPEQLGDAPKLDRALIRSVVLAKIWSAELEAGKVGSTKELARREGLCNHYLGRLLPLAYLAPDIVEKIVAGRQPRTLSLKVLTSQPLPTAWPAQREMIERLAA